MATVSVSRHYQLPEYGIAQFEGRNYRVPTTCTILAALDLDPTQVLLLLRRRLPEDRAGRWGRAIVFRIYCQRGAIWTDHHPGVTIPAALAGRLAAMIERAVGESR